jgi:hypothetical protein
MKRIKQEAGKMAGTKNADVCSSPQNSVSLLNFIPNSWEKKASAQVRSNVSWSNQLLGRWSEVPWGMEPKVKNYISPPQVQREQLSKAKILTWPDVSRRNLLV